MNTCRVLEVTLCADSLDELTSLDIYNAVWPRDAVTIGAVHAFRDSARDYVDYLVRDNGVILGSGVGAILGYRTDRCISLITVPVEHHKRGVGTALYGALSAWASERGGASWRCQSPTKIRRVFPLRSIATLSRNGAKCASC